VCSANDLIVARYSPAIRRQAITQPREICLKHGTVIDFSTCPRLRFFTKKATFVWFDKGLTERGWRFMGGAHAYFQRERLGFVEAFNLATAKWPEQFGPRLRIGPTSIDSAEPRIA
jgi:hypothetical protein